MKITNEQKQTILSGILGDGSISNTGNMSFTCIHEEYMRFKHKLLGDLCIGDVKMKDNNGYKKGVIYRVGTKANNYCKNLHPINIKKFIGDLDEL